MKKTVDKFFYPIGENYENLGKRPFECGNDVPVFEISGLHALIQLYGYAKFIFRDVGNVYLRGQETLYPRCLPSYFREYSQTQPNRARTKFGNLKKALKEYRCFKSVPEYSIEPLIQHYGIKTTWLDVVDNIWIALWFGLNRFRQKKNTNYFSYLERDDVGSDGEPSFLYLLFFISDGILCDSSRPGLHKGKETTVVDIRKSCPSIFHRPHIQHALLMKSVADCNLDDVDCMKYCVAVAKVRVSWARRWLGKSPAFSAEVLFPSPFEDSGLQHLADSDIDSLTKRRGLGIIHYR
ncbi:FRG domain-containing protein [Ruficoccus amylovorans]|uniref:FRG domain-containing protein n=1 Tax=Ruficoccus amylovorans TaxID=1804625 RepID=A0A842H953_9BACT|nr:FRG domain-containing protein [Ruficoccus amylovorans]MBC2592765.1 FRG domain-containing protein [Ruficoccus amylovorans]